MTTLSTTTDWLGLVLLRSSHLDEDLHVFQVFSVPLVEGLQQLQTVAGWAHVHLNNKESG